jgi:hypothetical protein
MTVVLGLIFGFIVVGTFATVLYIIVKGERDIDKVEPEATK